MLSFYSVFKTSVWIHSISATGAYLHIKLYFLELLDKTHTRKTEEKLTVISLFQNQAKQKYLKMKHEIQSSIPGNSYSVLFSFPIEPIMTWNKIKHVLYFCTNVWVMQRMMKIINEMFSLEFKIEKDCFVK